MKAKTLHRNIRSIHVHGSMVLAISAITLTAVKTNHEMSRLLRPVHESSVISSLHLRDAETLHGAAIVNIGVRIPTVGSQ